MNRLGVYVHFPWCRRRCPYCDFAIAVAPRGEIPHDRYLDAVLAELAARAPLFAPGRALESVYFGGGTPSLWRAGAIARVIDEVARAFGASPGALEVTVEANPEDCEGERLAALRAAGVNRLSIGAQSFDDAELVFLGREHDGARSLAALAAAREAGFDDVSIDLIYALPGAAPGAWTRTLARAALAAPPHLSVYQLTVEPRTTFGEAARRGRLVPAADERAAAEFEEAHATLAAAGWAHYEVSSYARPGHEARHNSLYWHGAEYLGLGSAAHSFWRPAPSQGVRFSTHRSVKTYLAREPAARLEDDGLVAELTRLDARALDDDALWLGLRTSAGVPARLAAGREDEVARLVAGGFLARAGDRVAPTPRGLLLADEIAARLLAHPLLR